MKLALVAALSLFVLGSSTDAFAANACVNAADKGQDLRSAGKLDEARAAFLLCTKATCNKVVRADCSRWALEIDAEKEANAAPEPAPPPPVVAPVPAQARVAIAIAEPVTTPAVPRAATFPVAPVVLGGIGVLSLAAFGYFQVQGWSRYASLEDGCAKTQSCTAAEIDGTRSQFVASGAALGVSVVSLGVAAILYLTRGASTEPSRIGVRPGGAAVSF